MTRLLSFLVLAVLLLPGIVSAQSTPTPLTSPIVTEAMLGDGWVMREPRPGITQTEPWQLRTVYVGPEGARIVIESYDLGDNLSTVSQRWPGLQEIWVALARTLRNLGDPYANAAPESSLPYPPTVSDALRVQGNDFLTNELTGVGLFASPQSATAIIVVVQGSVNDLSGVAAVNWVAEQFFTNHAA